MNYRKKQQCARCGSCTVVCPVFDVTGRESLTARGKLHLLSTELAGDPSANFQDLFARCLLCGACQQVCPRDMPIEKMVVEARSRFMPLYGQHALQRAAARVALSQPSLLAGLVKAGLALGNLSLLPEKSGLRIKLGLLEEDDAPLPKVFSGMSSRVGTATQGVTYFAGCLARYFQPSVAKSTGRMYHALTGDILSAPDAQVCCGLAAWSSGKLEEARNLARKNLVAFAETSGPILTSCASCSAHLFSYPDMFVDEPEWYEKALSFSSRVQEFSNFFLPLLEQTQVAAQSSVKLSYHEPCHLRFDPENRAATPQLLDGIQNITRVETQDSVHCCGQGGLFHLGYPELSKKIFGRLYESSQAEGAGVVVTTCSGCLMQWQAGLAERSSKARAVHLAVFLVDYCDFGP